MSTSTNHCVWWSTSVSLRAAEWSIKMNPTRTPTTNPSFVFAPHHHVRLGRINPFVSSWNTGSKPCFLLFHWLLDCTTPWCANSKIHQNSALQVGWFPLYSHTKHNTHIILLCRWFHAHWPIQFLIAGPIIFTGWALGHQTSTDLEGGHFQDPHQQMGLALLILYILQLTIGTIVHFFKFPTTFHGHRPPHSYFHVILGLAIIILAQCQVCYT